VRGKEKILGVPEAALLLKASRRSGEQWKKDQDSVKRSKWMAIAQPRDRIPLGAEGHKGIWRTGNKRPNPEHPPEKPALIKGRRRNNNPAGKRKEIQSQKSRSGKDLGTPVAGSQGLHPDEGTRPEGGR